MLAPKHSGKPESQSGAKNITVWFTWQSFTLSNYEELLLLHMWNVFTSTQRFHSVTLCSPVCYQSVPFPAVASLKQRRRDVFFPFFWLSFTAPKHTLSPLSETCFITIEKVFKSDDILQNVQIAPWSSLPCAEVWLDSSGVLRSQWARSQTWRLLEY